MKKLLLASTALVATAGFAAAAGVELSGSAEMGIKQENFSDDTEFHTDIGVTFTLSGESDGGVSFGGSVDLEDSGGPNGIATDDGSADYDVFISAGGATLTIGDTDGAFDKALTEVNIGGSLADDETAHAGFSGNGGSVDIDRPTAAVPAVTLNENTAGVDLNGDGDATDIIVVEDAVAAESGDLGLGMGLDGVYDGQVARFDYTIDSFTGSISAEIDDSGDKDPVWGLGVAYSAELAGLDLGIGLGYQTLNDYGSVAGISLSTTFANGLQAIVNYSKFTEDDGPLPDHSHAAIGIGYTSGALTIGANYGVYTLNEDALGIDDGDELSSGFGLAVNYDLGGGLEAQLGYGSSSFADELKDGNFVKDEDTDSFSLGLAMSF